MIADLLEPFRSRGRRERCLGRRSQKCLGCREPFFGRRDRAAEAAPLGRGVAEQDNEIIQLQHGAARGHAHQPAFRIRLPIPRRSGDDQIARLGIDKQVFDLADAGQGPHGFLRRLTGGPPQLDLFLQAGQRDLPQRRLRPRVSIAPAIDGPGSQFGQPTVGQTHRDLPHHARRVDEHAAGKTVNRPRSPGLDPGGGGHRRCDQFDQRVEIGHLGSAHGAESEGTRGQSLQQITPQLVIVQGSCRVQSGSATPVGRLLPGNLGHGSVPTPRVGNPLGQRPCRSELPGRQVSLDGVGRRGRPLHRTPLASASNNRAKTASPQQNRFAENRIALSPFRGLCPLAHRP